MDYKELVERLKRRESDMLINHPMTAQACRDAATAITDLLARAEAAEDRAEKAKRERDAAVKDLKEDVMGKIWACDYCKKNDPEDFQCKHDDLFGCSEWEWRGQKEE